jgi:hypothetical protein
MANAARYEYCSEFIRCDEDRRPEHGHNPYPGRTRGGLLISLWWQTRIRLETDQGKRWSTCSFARSRE